MLPKDSEIILTILISTALLVFFGAMIVYFVFRYQRKRFEHHKEMLHLKESFAQTLLKSKVEIQEQTLDHIAKELHSNINQVASLININLSAYLEDNNANENLIETKSLAKQLMTELKMLTTSLNTDFIMKIGFSRALENELLRISKAMEQPAILSKSGAEYRLSPEREIILFRLCQEVLNNSIRYSEASQISVKLNYLDDRIELELNDNGVGFDVERAMNSDTQDESTGIINIRKRAEVIKAKLQIHSSKVLGTQVHIQIDKEGL